jgi:hypothetical protein
MCRVALLAPARPHRATRDLDVLGFGDSNDATLRDVFNDVVTLKTEDDGVVFDAARSRSARFARTRSTVEFE